MMERVGLFILICLFCHVLDDFVFQVPILARLKQKSWWEEQFEPEELPRKYKYDYIPALMLHAFSWAFMIHIPLMLYVNVMMENFPYVFFICSILVHAIIHGIIDHMKANVKTINLIVDQTFHVLQIIIAVEFVFMVICPPKVVG